MLFSNDFIVFSNFSSLLWREFSKSFKHFSISLVNSNKVTVLPCLSSCLVVVFPTKSGEELAGEVCSSFLEAFSGLFVLIKVFKVFLLCMFGPYGIVTHCIIRYFSDDFLLVLNR